jgi:DNA mismatch repair protein MutS
MVVSVDHTEDLGYHLGITVARYKVYQTKAGNPLSFECLTNRAGKTCKLTSSEMKEVSHRLSENQAHLLEQVVIVYKEFLGHLYARYETLMKEMTQWVALIDFYQSNAKTSLLYHYCRPQIGGASLPLVLPSQKGDLKGNEDTLSDRGLKGGEASLIYVKQLRHPLIERIQESYQYVPQDVTLDSQQSGILLFSVNCAGKSSLMKAIGITIIMAQAGLYVPATTMIYSPYHYVLTRIVGNDNLFKGLSTFAVEMGELRGILRRADQYSLVLGDEICHGTETVSAVSIVAAAIITLSRVGANFLFASHLHTLSQMDRVTSLSNVNMFHLKVQFDQQTGRLIYDRRLEPGPGNPIYGLEVAKAMDLNPQFLELANDIRKELMEIDALVPIKKSKYNAQIYLNKCGIPDCPNLAEVTHHIQFQSEADSTGFIDNHLQKNHRSNLVPLCQSCHDKLHDRQPGHESYVIRGYQMTSEGSRLDFDRIHNPGKKRLRLKRGEAPIQPQGGASPP